MLPSRIRVKSMSIPLRFVAYGGTLTLPPLTWNARKGRGYLIGDGVVVCYRRNFGAGSGGFCGWAALGQPCMCGLLGWLTGQVGLGG